MLLEVVDCLVVAGHMFCELLVACKSLGCHETWFLLADSFGLNFVFN